jgi:predicted nucleotidyltransferase
MLENLSYLSKKLADLESVAAVVLFGSHARGDAGRKSDVDLLVLVDKHNPKLEERIGTILGGRESRVVPVVLTTEEFAKNKQLAFNILRDGIVFYKRAGQLDLPFALQERAVILYTFNISKQPQSKKVKINRALYGGTEKKEINDGVREYRYIGIVEQVGGRRTGKGSFLIPSKAESEVDDFFKKYNIQFTKTWMIEVAYDEG